MILGGLFVWVWLLLLLLEPELDPELLDPEEPLILPEPELFEEEPEPEESGDITSSVTQTHTYSQDAPQFRVNIFQPSAPKVTSSVPEPAFVPDQAPEAVQFEAEEDQVKVTVDPFEVLSVLEENSA